MMLQENLEWAFLTTNKKIQKQMSLTRPQSEITGHAMVRWDLEYGQSHNGKYTIPHQDDFYRTTPQLRSLNKMPTHNLSNTIE